LVGYSVTRKPTETLVSV